ncbi:Signal transduction histidine kinase [Rhodospirillaceae bacterium LM-1]|nr:Signal transduction histidine kinase [Rhodospirillaceae bacterium LM-1]
MRLKIWPQSILGRALAVLSIGLVASHLAALALYSGNRDEALSSLGGRQTAERIVGLASAMEEATPAEREKLARRMSRHGLMIIWSKDPMVTRERDRGVSNAIASELRRIAPPGTDIRVQPARFDDLYQQNMGPGMRGPGQGPGTSFMHDRSFLISLKLADASWLNVLAAAAPPDALWRGRFLLGFAATTLVTLLLAAWAVRRAVLPLRLFANAAERLGTDISAPPLTESGPLEVKRAAHAFNRMQERLKRFVDDRTRMLAAISHDLRTPLTRMRLRAEFVDDEDMRAKMLADLDEMEAMIGATLAFARDDAKGEERVPVDLAAMLAGLAAEATEAGQKVSLGGLTQATVQAAPMALKRALSNLIGNAVNYGGAAAITLAQSPGHFDIHIEDDGPGIPEDLHEQVFAPFFRVEGSRSKETGGVGLGLSVARGILRGHGGDVTLANRKDGGLRVTASLPSQP